MRNYCLLLLTLLASPLACAKQPLNAAEQKETCLGNWKISAVEDEAFFSNFRTKYPSTLKIGNQKAAYSTQYYYGGDYFEGFECSVNLYAHSETREVFFISCGVSSVPDYPSLFYKVKCEGDKLVGSVNSYKQLFEFKGQKVD